MYFIVRRINPTTITTVLRNVNCSQRDRWNCFSFHWFTVNGTLINQGVNWITFRLIVFILILFPHTFGIFISCSFRVAEKTLLSHSPSFSIIINPRFQSWETSDNYEIKLTVSPVPLGTVLRTTCFKINLLCNNNVMFI